MKQSAKLTTFLIIVVLALVLLITNVFSVSVPGYHVYTQKNIKEAANSFDIQTSTLRARRGNILDSSGNIIASDSQTYDLVAILSKNRVGINNSPAYVVDKDLTAQQIAPIINMDVERFRSILEQDKYQVEFGLLGRNLSLSQKEAIDELKLPGIEFIKTYKRQHPLGNFASNLIGFSNYDQEKQLTYGYMGIEKNFNKELIGTNGQRIYQKDYHGYIIDDTTIQETPAINGADVRLTLDQSIQEALEISFTQAKEQYPDTDNYFGAVMEVKTGKIVALSQSPSFDPNRPPQEIVYLNYGVDGSYEPGSTFKSFTYAAAIDSGNYSDEELFDTKPFYIGLKDGKIFRSPTPTRHGFVSNAGGWNKGMFNYADGFKESSNVGTAELVTKMGTDVWESYIQAFGFAKEVTTDRLTSSKGQYRLNRPIEVINTSFGQGITVNVLQMLQAYSAILTDGTMVKPYFIDKIVQNDGQVTYEGKTEIVGKPVKETAAKKVQDLMRYCVTEKGSTCYRLAIDSSEVLAKTGTAQIVVDGKYSNDVALANFEIGLPYEDPEVFLYWGFQGPMSSISHNKRDAIRALLQVLAMKYDANNDNNEEITNDATITEIPHFVNHSIDYVNTALSTSQLSPIILGKGDQVIKQLPHAEETIINNQKVFLLTNSDEILMPDMSGFSLKDVNNFWILTGVEITTQGSGQVVEQSIHVGEKLSKSTKIHVKLK